MFPIDPANNFKLLPSVAKGILKAGTLIEHFEPYPDGDKLVRVTRYETKELGQVRFEEVFHKIEKWTSASVQSSTRLLMRQLSPDIPPPWAQLAPVIVAHPTIEHLYIVDLGAVATASNLDTLGIDFLGALGSLLQVADFTLGLAKIVFVAFGVNVAVETYKFGFFPSEQPVTSPPVPFQWGWQGANGTGLQCGAGIRQEDVDHTHGSAGIRIAVPDTGISDQHESFRKGGAANPPTAIDPMMSGAFGPGGSGVFTPGNFTDTRGHGTHCASILIGRTSVRGFHGISPEATLLAHRIHTEMNNVVTIHPTDALSAIRYAATHQVRVVSMSWLQAESEEFRREIANAPNTLFVAGADNCDQDLATVLKFPICYDLPNLIGVIGAAWTGGLAFNSDYDSSGRFAHIAAPGESVAACGLGNTQYAVCAGNSMAVPHITGLAAMLFSLKPSATGGEVRDIILDSAFPTPHLRGRCRTGGRMDASAAIRLASRRW